MIERQIVAQKIKEREIQEFILSYLGALSCSHIKMQRTPLGERVTVYTNKPGLIVGKKGANIKILTKMLGVEIDMTELAVIAAETKERMKQVAAEAMGEYIGYFTEPIWEYGEEEEEE